jgi:hypothetical protein
MSATKHLFACALITPSILLFTAPAWAEEPSLQATIVEAIKSDRNLDRALRSAYDAANERLAGLKFDAFEAEIERAGGRELFATKEAGRSRLLLAAGVGVTASGTKHDLAVDVMFDPKTREVRQVCPVLLADLKRPIESGKLQELYPDGSVAARALRLPRVHEEAAKRPLLSRLELAYRSIGWPSNPVRGRGFTVDVEFTSTPTPRGARSSLSLCLAAFDVVETADVPTKVSVSSPAGTKLLSVPGVSMLDEPQNEAAFVMLCEEEHRSRPR